MKLNNVRVSLESGKAYVDDAGQLLCGRCAVFAPHAPLEECVPTSFNRSRCQGCGRVYDVANYFHEGSRAYWRSDNVQGLTAMAEAVNDQG